ASGGGPAPRASRPGVGDVGTLVADGAGVGTSLRRRGRATSAQGGGGSHDEGVPGRPGGQGLAAGLQGGDPDGAPAAAAAARAHPGWTSEFASGLLHLNAADGGFTRCERAAPIWSGPFCFDTREHSKLRRWCEGGRGRRTPLSGSGDKSAFTLKDREFHAKT